MSLIMPRMPKKRQKRSFIDRLLELGLIQDKKECRKKRQRKEKSGPQDDTDSESKESNSESDNSRSPSPVRIKPKKKEPRKKEERKRNNKRVDMSAKEIARVLVKAVDNGQTEALTWLAENLEEVALDQEAQGYDPTSEGTPLVPISKDSIDAMEDKMFQKVLKAVGVMPPSDEQETYWRIPADLHHETIRKRREIILKAINKELIVDTNISDNETDNINTDMVNDSDSNDNQNDENSNNDYERNNDINIDMANDTDSNGNHNDENSNNDNERNNDINVDMGNDSDSNDNRQIENNDIRRVQKSSLFDTLLNNDDSDSDDDENKTNKINNDSDDDGDKNKTNNDVFGKNNTRNSRKRVRSVETEEQVNKLARIDEDDEDILSFAKKTLNTEILPDTEDILSALPRRDDDSSDEDAPINIPKRKKRLVVSDDESD